MNQLNTGEIACPITSTGRAEVVALAHGEGGLLSRRLIQERIVPALGGLVLDSNADAALLPGSACRLAMTTDSFVVTPLFFPGGDIGSLAVYGTANDLAVAGARPRWLSLSFILEEGFELATFDRVLASIAAAARIAQVSIVTGDTKVVPRGAADGVFINTTGIGELLDPAPPGPASLQVGDLLLVSGPIAQHGIAVLEAREAFGFEPAPASDCAPLWPSIEALDQAGIRPRAMRDATRGGVAALLHEWSAASGRSLVIDETAVPVLPEIRAACELLGLDPLHIANEGTLVAAIPGDQVERALAALQQLPQFARAAVIGRVEPAGAAPVAVRRALGRLQPLDEPLGAPLPRIC